MPLAQSHGRQTNRRRRIATQGFKNYVFSANMLPCKLLQFLGNYQQPLMSLEIARDTLYCLNQQWLVVKDVKKLLGKIGLTKRPESLTSAAGKDYREFLNISPLSI